MWGGIEGVGEGLKRPGREVGERIDEDNVLKSRLTVINFIWTYLYQFLNDCHCLNGSGKPLKRPFDQYQLHLKEINIGWDIRQISR